MIVDIDELVGVEVLEMLDVIEFVVASNDDGEVSCDEELTAVEGSDVVPDVDVRGVSCGKKLEMLGFSDDPDVEVGEVSCDEELEMLEVSGLAPDAEVGEVSCDDELETPEFNDSVPDVDVGGVNCDEELKRLDASNVVVSDSVSELGCNELDIIDVVTPVVIPVELVLEISWNEPEKLDDCVVIADFDVSEVVCVELETINAAVVVVTIDMVELSCVEGEKLDARFMVGVNDMDRRSCVELEILSVEIVLVSIDAERLDGVRLINGLDVGGVVADADSDVDRLDWVELPRAFELRDVVGS